MERGIGKDYALQHPMLDPIWHSSVPLVNYVDIYTIYPVTSKSCVELSFDRKVIGKIVISIRCVF